MRKTAKVELAELAGVLQQYNRPVLLTHVDPDVDGLGSLLSLARVLEAGGKEVLRFAPEAVPAELPFLKDTDLINQKVNWQEADVFVALDCGEIKRTGVENEIAKATGDIINIDHHPQPKPFGDINHVDPQRSSTAEIVYELLQTMKAKIDKPIADMLLAGIVCDTQSFQVAATSAKVLEISSELMRRGARMPLIAKDLFRVKPITALKLWGRVLDRMQVDKDTHMAYSIVHQADFAELGGTPRDLEGVVDLINSVSGSRFSLLLSEDGDNVVKGSLRSEEFKAVDVSKIAELFGGGGHKLASGFRLKGKLQEKDGRWIITRK